MILSKLFQFSLLPAFLLCISSAQGKQKEVISVIDAFARAHPNHNPANARSCAECHSTPGEGGSSRRTVMRAGSIVAGKYVPVPNGGILHTINYQTPATSATLFGPRVTLNLVGDGYIEALSDQTLENIARMQAKNTQGKIHGEVVYVTANRGSKVVGRFGWKAQHASVLDAAADALLHELGVSNRIFQAEVLTTQKPAGAASHSTEDADGELDAMVDFIRRSEPVAPDPARSEKKEAQVGSEIFDRIGCSICHVRTLKTAPPGTRLRGSSIVVSEQFGNKEIHPYSDYLLHDIGTGDGIVQNVRPEDYAQSTANKFRTAPLWGVRFRLWMMHDGKSVSYHQAIMRHRGEALSVTLNYAHLTPAEQEELRQFLDSL